MAGQIAVGRGDQPDVDPQRPGAAQPLEFVFLQDAQDLRLGAGAHVPDFVEEEASAVALFEPADALLVGAGEGAFFLTEQHPFEKVLLERRAVHLDEVPRCPQRIVVNRPGDQLLAGAGFTANEHRGVALGDLFDDVEDGLKRRARADDAIEVVDILLGAAQVLQIVLHALDVERLLDLDFHLLDLERLLHVVERADLHRFDGRVHRSKCRHQDHGGRRMHGAGGTEDVHAVAAAHLQVAQDHVEMAIVQALDGGVDVRCFFDVVAGFGQAALQTAPERVVIVRNQYSPHNLHASLLNQLAPLETFDTGSVTRKRVPLPGAAATSIRPS